MSMLNETTVLIPVKNEEKAIGMVLDEVLSIGIPPERIVVVDGHSTDRTVELAKSKGVVVVTQEETGKGDAIRTGLKYVSTRYVVVMDGDYTYPAKYIPALVRVAEEKGCRYIFGIRMRRGDNMSFLNRFGNWLLTKIFNILIGGELQDVCTGMYLADVSELRDTLFEMKGFSVEVELAAHVVGSGIPYCEYKIEYRRRLGEKKLSILDGLRIAIDIVRLAWRYNPVTFMLGITSLIIIPGLVLGLHVAYHYFFTGVKYYVKGLIAIILTLIGLQSLMLTLLSVYLKRMELRIRRLLRKMLG